MIKKMNDAITRSLADADQPLSTFIALEKFVNETIGIKLFTLMEIDNKENVARRNYSNMPDAYPVSGEKPMEFNSWSMHVLENRQTFVANSIVEIADVFPDYELIQSLGCESCLNLPIVVADNVIGTLNCLNVAGHYTPERVQAAKTLRQAGALAFLMSNTFKSR